MDLKQQFRIMYDMIDQLANTRENGLTTGELAKQYGVDRKTIKKYVDIMINAGLPIEEDKQRYHLDSNHYASFTLDPEESEFLYIILERSLRQHHSQWRILHTLLRKLGNKMTQPLSDYLTSQVNEDMPLKPIDKHFKVIAQAKREQREIVVNYHPLHRGDPTRWQIRPFGFTSNPLSDGLYILCEGRNLDSDEYRLLSLKFNRILSVSFTEQYFGALERLPFSLAVGNAWGVYNSDKEPVDVLLRFEPRHYDRLLETNWHKSQTIYQENNDGYVYYRVHISEPDEMIPWIRSWGSGVTVLEPKILRNRMLQSLQKQIKNYGLAVNTTQTDNSLHHLLWAKYDHHTGDYHLLLYHLLDVGAVASLMWHKVLSQSIRTWIQKLLNSDATYAVNLLIFLATTHDIGKATPGFQQKAKPLYNILLEADLDATIIDKPHGLFSAAILKQWLIDKGVATKLAWQIAVVIGGHHGVWINTQQLQEVEKKNWNSDEKWLNLQRELLDLLSQYFAIDTISLPEHPHFNEFATFVSGFISVCDWIGSNTEYFPYETRILDIEEYYQRSLEQAENALIELGWFGWKPDKLIKQFDAMFSFVPNNFQQTAIDIFSELEQPPKLILVEYLTGGGKTELALYLADMLMNELDLVGTYVAMPTQATSNQMFGRFSQYLESRYPNDAINLQLIHAQAEHQQYFQAIAAQREHEGNENGLIAETWFQNRKRSLLAPHAVGTIDQAMLSVLQVKHHFVRQFALSHKVIIFDEIHSYDSYMNAIINTLLEWLTQLGSPIILLSATLAEQNRYDLLESVNAITSNLDNVPYPRMTIVEANNDVSIHPLPKPETRKVYIEHVPSDIESFCNWLIPLYEAGGCIAIICNTVDESILIAEQLKNHTAVHAKDIWIFHARFPPIWRQQIEESVLNAFGKSGNRPKRAILVATQIIEQSLDIDFDFMISSTAPIDLLIQRLGRLHRHSHHERPDQHTKPKIAIRTPELIADDVPYFGIDEVIYARFILLKTWLVLRTITELHIPDDIDEVMNFVYNEETDIDVTSKSYQEALIAAHEDMLMKQNRDNFSGKNWVIGEVSDKRLIGQHNWGLDDENHNISTRNILPSVDIICMLDESWMELTTRRLSKKEQKRLLQHKLSIRNKNIKQAIEDNLLSIPAWERIPQLRHTRVCLFKNSTFTIPNSPYRLYLTREFGLQIINMEAL